MLISPHTLSIITTHRCTAACDHCCFSCTPDAAHPSIPVPNIHRYIEQASEIQSLKAVVLTGGECFLLGKDLDEVVGTITRNKFRSRFVSNGYWAPSVTVAKRRLEKLVAKGLNEANFSTGDAHMKYVPPGHVRNGAIAAADLGLTVFVMVELHARSTFDFEAFISDPTLKEYIESRRIVIQHSPWMRFSGSQRLEYTRRYLQEMGNGRKGGCTTIMKVIAITPTESLVSCCGLTLEEIPELHLGSLQEKTLPQLLAEAPDDFLKIWIHLQGPEAVIRYARSIDPTIPAYDNSAHICEICREMYHDPKIAAAVMKSPPPFRGDLVQQYVMDLAQPLVASQLELNNATYKGICSLSQAQKVRKTALLAA